MSCSRWTRGSWLRVPIWFPHFDNVTGTSPLKTGVERPIEPFAVSPYRLLILRHAWLNL